MKVDTSEVRVRDARGLGVVADGNNTWLMPPDGPPGTQQVYRNFAVTASLTRTPAGGVEYSAEHWALGTRVDTTPLFGADGKATWASTPGASARLERAIQRGGEVRLHPVPLVRDTGPFGMCNGTLFDACVTNPAVSMSVATDTANIEEVRTVRTPMRAFGIGEVILGAVAVGAAGVATAALLPEQPGDARNVVFGVGAGVAVLGALAIANGLWRLFTPDETFVFVPAKGP
jgi:hypothetical protein